MNENPNDTNRNIEEPEIVGNDYGATRDSAVVIEEANRTVLLTDNETIVIEKEPQISVVPKNRPRKIYAGMWGPTEIATVGLGMLAVLASILLYIFVVLPANKELEANKKKRAELDTELLSTRSKYGDIEDAGTRANDILASVNDFETRHLRNALLDKTSLYQRLNGLIAAYSLTNTTGPDYAPLDIVDAQNANRQQSESERGREKYQSIFPGDYVTMTVEGSYQNLRRFIREIETSDQFITIAAIEFQPAETEQKIDRSKPPQQNQQINNVTNPITPNGIAQYPTNSTTVPETAETQRQRGKMRGEIVSLRLEMAAYFRRPNVQPTLTGNQQQ